MKPALATGPNKAWRQLQSEAEWLADTVRSNETERRAFKPAPFSLVARPKRTSGTKTVLSTDSVFVGISRI